MMPSQLTMPKFPEKWLKPVHEIPDSLNCFSSQPTRLAFDEDALAPYLDRKLPFGIAGQPAFGYAELKKDERSYVLEFAYIGGEEKGAGRLKFGGPTTIVQDSTESAFFFGRILRSVAPYLESGGILEEKDYQDIVTDVAIAVLSPSAEEEARISFCQ